MARRIHASPLRPAYGPAFANAARRLKSRVSELPDNRVTVEIQRMVAILGDGHSLVYPMPARGTSFAMLPVDVYLFADGLFVVGGVDSGKDLIGCRILRIGSVPVDELLTRMTPYVSRDNEMGVKAFASLFLIMPEFLAAWGATDDSHRAVLTMRDTTGAMKVVRLEAGPPRRIAKRVQAPAFASTPLPLYLRQPDRQIWMTRLENADLLYVQFNQVTDSPGVTLAEFARMLADTLRLVGPRGLIVDVRHNVGGNNELIAPLVQTIALYAAADSRRAVYVVTSRSTFSAAQNFINRVERSTPTAVFAGEPSMSSPNFTGEDNPTRLPYSGLVISISNRYWQDSRPDDHRAWIEPRLRIPLRSTDWLHNRDPVLEAVLRDFGAR
jgi:hypothetical protein